MPKKAVKKRAKKAKKAPKKSAVKKIAVEKPVAEKPLVQDAPAVEVQNEAQATETKPEETVQETKQDAPAEAVIEAKQDVPKEAVIEAREAETKEESKMADDKGIGKDYNPAEFSKPAVHAGASSKIYWYVGICVVVVALIVGGLFFSGVFKGIPAKSLTGATVVTAYCTDTDGGYNRFTKGVAEGTYYLNYAEGTYMDECASGEENKLTEYYCKNDLIVYATEPCPQGMTCVDGICQ